MGHWGAKTPWFRLPRHLVFKTSRTSRLQADWSVSKKVAGWIWNCCHVSAWSHWAGELWWNVILFIIVYGLSSEDGFICFVVSFNCDVRKATWKSVGSFRYCVSSPCRRSRPLVAVSLLLLRSLVGTRLGKRVLLSCQWAGPVSKSQITCNTCNKYVQTQNHWFPHRQRPISGTWVPSLVQCLHPSVVCTETTRLTESFSCLVRFVRPHVVTSVWMSSRLSGAGTTPTTQGVGRSPRHIASAGNFQIDSRPQTVQGKLMHLIQLQHSWTWETNELIGRQMMGDKWRETTAPQADTP
jgi:hypothetical protein